MLRSWKLIGRPLCICPIAWMLQPPMNASASTALVRPAPVLAERQLQDAADHEAMRHVELREPLLVVGVGRIQHEHLLGELRPRVGGEHRVALREALLELELRRVVAARAVDRRACGRCRTAGTGAAAAGARRSLPLNDVPGSSPRNGFGTCAVRKLIVGLIARRGSSTGTAPGRRSARSRPPGRRRRS